MQEGSEARANCQLMEKDCRDDLTIVHASLNSFTLLLGKAKQDLLFLALLRILMMYKKSLEVTGLALRSIKIETDPKLDCIRCRVPADGRHYPHVEAILSMTFSLELSDAFG